MNYYDEIDPVGEEKSNECLYCGTLCNDAYCSTECKKCDIL
jgi:hypothetical protein